MPAPLNNLATESLSYESLNPFAWGLCRNTEKLSFRASPNLYSLWVSFRGETRNPGK